jgi:hypothetical protein
VPGGTRGPGRDARDSKILLAPVRLEGPVVVRQPANEEERREVEK